jgi:hypothetical protein
VKWKEAKAALAEPTPVVRSKGGSAPRLAALKAKLAEPSAEQVNLGPGWNHVVRGGRVFRAAPADPLPTSHLVPVNRTTTVKTNTSAKGKTAKSAPKVTVGPKQTPVTKSVKPTKPTKTLQPETKKLVVPAHPDRSPIE